MTTTKKAQANKKNALKSTGPKTTAGKARASLNALKHGLRAVSLAVPFLEDPADWTAHHDLVVRDLAPVGYLETILSERAAALLWRLGRVVRYESEVVSSLMVKADEGSGYSSEVPLETLRETKERADEKGKAISRVQGLKGKAHVSGEDADLVLGVAMDALEVDGEEVEDPAGFPEDTYWGDFDGWTKDMVDEALHNVALASENKEAAKEPWVHVLVQAIRDKEDARKAYEKRAAKVDQERRTSLLPGEKTLDKVSRYESHLERALFRTLHELERLKAARTGTALPPPAVLDVNLHQEAS